MKIYSKLQKIQDENIKIEKDGKNPFFKNQYSTLNEVLSKLRPALEKEKLVITQLGTIDGITTRVADSESGEFIDSFIPYIGATDMQKLGGAITYARRYALIAMFNLESEDDDGNTAVFKKQEPITKKDIMSDEIDY